MIWKYVLVLTAAACGCTPAVTAPEDQPLAETPAAAAEEQEPAPLEPREWTVSTDMVAKEAFETALREAWASFDYVQLDALGREALQSAEYFADGESRVRLYQVAIKEVEGEHEIDKLLHGLAQWRRLVPDSDVEKLFRVRWLIERAWDIRGDGFAREVPEENWEGFYKHHAQAEELLSTLFDKGPINSWMCSEAIRIVQGKNYDAGVAVDLFLTGLQIDPFDVWLHANIQWIFQPQWGGKPGELLQVAELVEEVTAEQWKLAPVYFMVYTCGKQKELFRTADQFEWGKIKSGYREFRQLFPGSDYHASYFATFACARGEREAACEQMQQKNDVWTTQYDWGPQQFQVWRAWACEAGDLPANTPLHTAASDGKLAAVRRQLERGAAPEPVNQYGLTPLHYAVTNSHWPVVEALMAYGAKMNHPVNGMALISLAARDGQVALVEAMLKQGADVNSQYDDGWTLVHEAARKGNLPLLQLLLAQPQVLADSDSASFSTPITGAARVGHLECVKLLLKAGAQVDGYSEELRSPLIQAAEAGHLEVAAYLLENGANPNKTAMMGWTALNAAVSKNHPHIVKILLEHGAEVNHQGAHGMTAVHHATQADNIEILRLLLEHDASGVNLRATPIQRAPLHTAVKHRNAEIVRYLLSKGADPKVKEVDDETSFDYARLLKYDDMMQILQEAR